MSEYEGLEVHVPEVAVFSFATFVASVLTFGLCCHFLDYAGRGPVPGSTATVIAAYSLSVVGACSTMIQSLIVHAFSPELSWVEALFWSSLIRFLMAVPFVIFDFSQYATTAAGGETKLLIEKDPPKQDFLERYGMLALRGFMGTFGGHVALYWGVQFLFPSEAAALWSTSPFFSIVFGYLIVGEMLSPLTVGLICTSFIGVIMVIQPVEMVSWLWMGGFDMSNMAHTSGCLLVLLGGACQGMLGPMMRALKWTVFEVVTWTAGTGIFIAVAVAIFSLPGGVTALWAWFSTYPSTLAATGWIGLIGVSSFFSTYFLNWGWQLEPAGAVDMVNRSIFVGAMLVFQLCVLKEISNAIAIAGILLCVVAGVGIIYSRLIAHDEGSRPPSLDLELDSGRPSSGFGRASSNAGSQGRRSQGRRPSNSSSRPDSVGGLSQPPDPHAHTP